MSVDSRAPPPISHLVSLAQEDVPDGTSIMCDEDSDLELGSVPLVFQKREKLSPQE